MRRLALVAASTLAMACASHSTPSNPTPANPAAPPPAPPPSSTTQGLRLGPSALRYVMAQAIHVEQELPTGPQNLDYGLRVFFAVTINGPADSVGYPTTVTIDSITADSGTTLPPMSINLSAAKGLTYTGRLQPKGEFQSTTVSDSAASLALSPIVGAFKNFFPRLPGGGATLGATWADTSEETNRAAGTVTITSINRSNAVRWEDRNKTRSLRIEVVSDFTLKGGGQQMGQQYDISGTGRRNGVDFVAVDGRYLGGESLDSTTMTISLPVQGLTIPRKQVSRSTVTVLP